MYELYDDYWFFLGGGSFFWLCYGIVMVGYVWIFVLMWFIFLFWSFVTVDLECRESNVIIVVLIMFFGFVVLSDLVRMFLILESLMMVFIGLLVIMLVFLDVGLRSIWFVLNILIILCVMVVFFWGIFVKFFFVILIFFLIVVGILCVFFKLKLMWLFLFLIIMSVVKDRFLFFLIILVMWLMEIILFLRLGFLVCFIWVLWELVRGFDWLLGFIFSIECFFFLLCWLGFWFYCGIVYFFDWILLF